MRKRKWILLSSLVFLLTACGWQDKIVMFRQKELLDKRTLILNEVAVIDSLQNEYINVKPKEDEVLLISVIEVENKNRMDLPIDSYFKQQVHYREKTYDGQVFSLDGKKVRAGRQAYVYLINPVPSSLLDEMDSRHLQVELFAGESNLLFSGEINNNYGLQDNITNKYQRIQFLEEDFNKYWANDLNGFRKFAEQRMQIKNYQQIFDWVAATQLEYQKRIEILEINLEQMKEMNYLTPIYPDANVKMISEASFIKSKMEAIVNIENTCTSEQGVQLFIEGCKQNLEEAQRKNKVISKEIQKSIRSERMKYGGFRK